LAPVWFVAPGLQVLPEYVPPEAVHIVSDLSFTEVEQAASGSTSRASGAMFISTLLEPIGVASR